MSHARPISPLIETPADQPRASTLLTVVLWVQGVYYLVTGVWPLVSMETFQMVTGPKVDHLIPSGGELVVGEITDHWLVKTVGVLVTASAVVLLYAAWRRRAVPETVILAIGNILALTAIDVIYVLRETIPPIYLADAAVEVVLLAGWVVGLLMSPARERGMPAASLARASGSRQTASP